MKAKQTTSIYQSRRGITLTDGYFLVRNPNTKIVAIISITQGMVSIHNIKSQMNIQNLVNMESIGQLDVFGSLKLIEPEKPTPKNKKDDN